ncbi:MAG: argininosuccinate synthase [Acidobacteriota bacterium]|nr:argininosuccinate synthase [Acidobacteriota bacterium]
MKKSIVLAYSGGLRSSVAIPWLVERGDADVITVTLDLGQSADLVAVRERAMASGAIRSHVLDTREEFVRDFVLPTLKADALSEGRYPMATALGRPMIAKKLAEIARLENATIVAHGCSGRDRVRLARPLRALDPSLTELALVDEWGLANAAIAGYADRLGISSAGLTEERVDDNLWGRTIGRRGDDAAEEAPETLFKITRPLAQTPAQPATVAISFEHGAPTGINGVVMPLVELIESLSTIAGEHGCGRLERVKNHSDGSRSRAVYEAPAAAVLHLAHSELERFVSSDNVDRFLRTLSSTYADAIDRGDWFDRLRSALDASVGAVQSGVTGTVRIRLFKGDCRVVGRSANP